MENPVLFLKADKDFVFAVDEKLNFLKIRSEVESSKGKLDLLMPTEIAIKPIVTMSEQFALIGFPWLSSFRIIPGKNVHEKHALPITCLANCDHRCVSASRDCSLRLWKVRRNGKVDQVHFLAKHTQPVVLLEVNVEMNASISVTRDGFVMEMSLLDGRYVAGFELEASNPSHLLVTNHGFSLICFNGADSHVIFVLDQNLIFVTKNTLNGCVLCWTSMEKNGIEYALIALVSQIIVVVKLPFLEKPIMGIAVTFVPSFMTYARKQGVCYLADSKGCLHGWIIGRNPAGRNQ
jgi:WD40 repeat protein